MSKRFEICESCIDLHLPGADREAVLRHLAGLLVRQGLVEPAYVEKILEREASCPTGLPFPAMTIALPHGDPAFVRRASMAVGRCPEPVVFYSMEDPSEALQVEMVVLLAVNDPDEHLAVLNNLMEMFTRPQVCQDLRAAQSRAQVCGIFRQMLCEA